MSDKLKTITIADVERDSISPELLKYISTFAQWEDVEYFNENIISLYLAEELVDKEALGLRFQLEKLMAKADDVSADFIRIVDC